MANIQIRISAQNKEKFQMLVEDMGLNFSSAIKIFINKSIQEGRIPFDLTGDEEDNDLCKKEVIESKNPCTNFTRRKIG